LLLIALCGAVVIGCSKKTVPTAPPADAAATSISGTVRDFNGLPLPGVSIVMVFYSRQYRHFGAKACSLIEFTANPGDDHVGVHWADSLESDNYQWVVQRAVKADVPSFQTIASLPAAGTSPHANVYSYADSNATNGRLLYYRLDEVDLSGGHRYHGPCAVYTQTAHTDAHGAYLFTSVPVDEVIPVLGTAGATIGTDTIGTTYSLYMVYNGSYSAWDTITVSRDAANRIDFTFYR
jgi:hypothetical protein